MTVSATLRASILDLLGAVDLRLGDGVVNGVSDGNRCYAYEVYCWCIAVRAAKLEGWNFDLAQQINGVARFRTSNGVLPSPDFTYGVLEKNGIERELHQGVKVMGASGVSHQADVVLVESQTAVDTRPPYPPDATDERIAELKVPASAIGVIEAKFFENGSDVEIGVARERVGFLQEIKSKVVLAVAFVAAPNVGTILNHHTITLADKARPKTPQEPDFIAKLRPWF